MRSPDPPVQLRQFLSVAKRQGQDFASAWDWAWERIRNPHDTTERRGYKEAISDTKWAWERAYRDEDIPGGPVLGRLAEWLAAIDDEHDPNPVREPVMTITGKQGNREGLDFVNAKAS